MEIALWVCLVILIVVGVWAVVEIALTIRKARSSLDTLLSQADATLTQVGEILDTADKTLTELQPSVQQLPGLLQEAERAIDVLSNDLATADTILADVSVLTGTAMNATNAISRGASQASTALGSAVAKVGKTISEKIAPKPRSTSRIEALEERRLALEERVSEIADSVGVELPSIPKDKTEDEFFTYPTTSDEASAASREPSESGVASLNG